jgi:glycosyltransferase (activator-dependent family)
MRALFVCTGHESHFLPMVPLAWALRTAGHDVRVAAPPDIVQAISNCGLTAVPVGVAGWQHDDDPVAAAMLGELFVAGGIDHVQYFDYTGRDPQQWSWQGLLALQQIMTPAAYASMNNRPMIDDAVAFARRWEPDLVVRETYTWAGGVIAAAVGAAHARMVHGPDTITRVRQAFLRLGQARAAEHREDPTAEWLGQELAKFGREFSEDVVTGHFTIDQTPPSTRLDLGLHTVSARYVPFNGPAVLPGWLRAPAERRRICLTGGLAARQYGTAAFSSADLLDALADLDVEVVATMSAEESAKLSTVPDNVRTVEFAPMHDLLPTCAAIVHHGGAGTEGTAEYHGVPQLIVSDGWEVVVKAELLAELGAGLHMTARDSTPALVREHVRRLLEEPRFAANADRLRTRLLAEPTCNEIVPVLERLTDEYRTQPVQT